MSTVLERPVTHRRQRDQEAPRTAEAPTAPVGRGEAVLVASRATWAATSSAGASALTTAGLQFGTAGVVSTLVLGAGGAVGVAALRRFAPAAAARWGLHRRTGGHRSTPTPPGSRGSSVGTRARGRRGGGPLSGGGAGGAGRGRGLLSATRRGTAGGQRAGGRQGTGTGRGLLGGLRGARTGHRRGAGVAGGARRGRGLLAGAGHGPGRLGFAGRAGAGPAARVGGAGSRTSSSLPGRRSKRPGSAGITGSDRNSRFHQRAGVSRFIGGKPGLWAGLRRRGEAGKGGRAQTSRRRAGLLKRAPQLPTSVPDHTQPSTAQKRTRTTAQQQQARPANGGTSPHGDQKGNTAMPNPFHNHNEALAQVANNLDIHNARALIDWVDGAPGAAERQAGVWRQHAGTIQESIPVSGEFAEAINDFAATQARQAERIREAGTVFRRTHQEELRRIEEPRPGEDKWDVSANR
ncbi:MAG: hypothetical protein JO063_14585 [Pseudonocardiales bacterium]|nr:hypothetical protein [Pseudonocardiales bacterium]